MKARDVAHQENPPADNLLKNSRFPGIYMEYMIILVFLLIHQIMVEILAPPEYSLEFEVFSTNLS